MTRPRKHQAQCVVPPGVFVWRSRALWACSFLRCRSFGAGFELAAGRDEESQQVVRILYNATGPSHLYSLVGGDVAECYNVAWLPVHG